MIDKTESCALCGVEICFACGIEGIGKIFCSDECAEAYAATKTPLPCPFCGHAAKTHCYGDGLLNPRRYDVSCSNNKCPVAPEMQGFAPNRIAAIQRWNTRVDL